MSLAAAIDILATPYRRQHAAAVHAAADDEDLLGLLADDTAHATLLLAPPERASFTRGAGTYFFASDFHFLVASDLFAVSQCCTSLHRRLRAHGAGPLFFMRLERHLFERPRAIALRLQETLERDKRLHPAHVKNTPQAQNVRSACYAEVRRTLSELTLSLHSCLDETSLRRLWLEIFKALLAQGGGSSWAWDEKSERQYRDYHFGTPHWNAGLSRPNPRPKLKRRGSHNSPCPGGNKGFPSFFFQEPQCKALADDREICRLAMQLDGAALRLLPRHMRHDFELCLLACQQTGRAIIQVGHDFCRDDNNVDLYMQLARAAVLENPMNLQHVKPKALRYDIDLLSAAAEKWGIGVLFPDPGVCGGRKHITSRILKRQGKSRLRAVLEGPYQVGVVISDASKLKL